jgi:hypothetical protein
MTQPPSNTPPTPLPTLFLVAAEAALVSGGHDPGVAERLARARTFIEPILTTENLLEREDSLLSAAMEYHEARAKAHAAHEEPDADTQRWSLIEDGVEIGLVAGYLLARMLADAGAR